MEHKILSYRAECYHDVQEVEHVLKEHDVTFTRAELIKDSAYPDVEVEMHCELGVEEVKELIQELPDVHVICETLAELPIEENPMER